MRKTQDWDLYFRTHYHPVENKWGRKDVEKYRRWYGSWITYLESRMGFSFAGHTALELGCGIGSFCSLLKDRGCIVTGSDIAESMVAAASSANPTIPFLTYDVLTPFPGKANFDYVCAFEVLEHLPKPKIGIHNIWDILKPGGWFIGSTPYPYSKNMKDPTHVNVHKPEYWKKLFLERGFANVLTIPASFFPFLWRIHESLHPIIPFYIPFPFFVSTTIVVAQKK